MNDATESSASLTARVVNVYTQDLLKHLVEIAGRLFGSMRMLGKPVGLYHNIGGGVKDFFYEVQKLHIHSLVRVGFEIDLFSIFVFCGTAVFGHDAQS